ncbi:MAG TPA: xanthine dehydrogenase family protein subunit M [Myxococcota bacterium]|nr:xanthine dehydrogenase family protein subunit M [Myxococcota bacterium]
MSAFAYHRPHSIAEALRLKNESPDARFVAGGTDVMVKINCGAMRPAALISLRAIPELGEIDLGETTSIGASTTIADLLRDVGLCTRYPLLSQAAHKLGGPQIRNLATIGGNLCNCSPCADTAPALLALEARVRLASPLGEREIAIEDFMTGPGQTCSPPDEILTHVLLPKAPSGALGIYLKKGRVCMDLAIVSLAVLLVADGDELSRVRLAAGSVAPVCLRLRKAEDLLAGKRVTPKLLAQAAQAAMDAVTPIDDLRASADYRRRLVGVYLRRALESLLYGNEP